MSTKTKAEELADEYARCAAKTTLENLYGTSKSYTEQCLQHENAARGKLMAELRRLAAVEAERDRLAAEVEALRADIAGYVRASSELASENEALRTDKELLDWLSDSALSMDAVADPDNLTVVFYGTDPCRQAYGRTLRAAVRSAIDASRGKG